MDSNLLRGLALSLGLISGGIGGDAPDFDHLLNKITGGQISWDFLHQPWSFILFAGLALTSSLGLYFTLFLRR